MSREKARGRLIAYFVANPGVVLFADQMRRDCKIRSAWTLYPILDKLLDDGTIRDTWVVYPGKKRPRRGYVYGHRPYMWDDGDES